MRRCRPVPPARPAVAGSASGSAPRHISRRPARSLFHAGSPRRSSSAPLPAMTVRSPDRAARTRAGRGRALAARSVPSAPVGPRAGLRQRPQPARPPPEPAVPANGRRGWLVLQAARRRRKTRPSRAGRCARSVVWPARPRDARSRRDSSRRGGAGSIRHGQGAWAGPSGGGWALDARSDDCVRPKNANRQTLRIRHRRDDHRTWPSNCK